MSRQPFMKRRRPTYLLTGLVKCGACGGGMANIGGHRLGCLNARDSGTCDNRLTMLRKELEGRILTALERQLLRPELFAEFCAEYTRTVNEVRLEKNATRRATAVELDRITRELDRLIDAIVEGAPAARVRDRMAQLEERRAILQAETARAEPQEPYLHPNMGEVYRRRVAELATALSADDSTARAAREDIRSLIDKVILTPTAGVFGVELVGDLGGILNCATGRAIRVTALSGGHSDQALAGTRLRLSRGGGEGLYTTAA